MNYEQIIDGYEALRERIYKLATDNKGALMGDSAWLCFAIQSSDIRMSVWADGSINCWGTCYTTQTMSNEWFDFTIPGDLIGDINA